MSSDISVSHSTLRNSISLLTGLLQGVSPAYSSERLIENGSRAWETLQSVTTLLNITEDPAEDSNSGHHVVAATYSTGPNGIEALPVKNTRPSDMHITLVAPHVTKLIDKPLNDKQVEELLGEWWVLRYRRPSHSVSRLVSKQGLGANTTNETFSTF